MRVTIQVLGCLAAAGTLAQTTPGQFTPAGPGDVRAPCPMLNALANHGYLPRDGKNISENVTAAALDTALNIPPAFGTLLHKVAVRTNPDGNATNTFSLNDLGRHNILEHDASLSRQDAFFGDPLAFNQTVFDETRSHWQATIDVPQAAAARLARVTTSNATNPTFGFSKIGTQFSLGESAAYIVVLGDPASKTVNRTVVEYLFENERLPTEVGWTRPAQPLNPTDLFTVVNEIVNITAASTGATQKQVRGMVVDDMHMLAARGAV